MATHKDRIDRLNALEELIPAHGPPSRYPSSAQLLERAAARYEEHRSDSARRRALQRDLEELVRDERIVAVNPASKPLSYRRMRDEPDTGVWDYVRRVTRALIDTALPLHRFDALWPQVFKVDGLGLGEDKLRIVSDTLRLQPAAIRESVLTDVLDALARSLTLHVG